MSKGQHLTHYQKGIVNRYYHHLDTIALAKLQEAVSDLFMRAATKPAGPAPDKVADKLWKSVENALAKTSADPARVQRMIAARDIKALGELVNSLAAAKPAAETPRKRAAPDPDAL